MGLDVTCSVVWYQIGRGSPPGGEGKLHIKTTRKATGNYLAIFFLRHVMDCAIVSKDNSINKAISQGPKVVLGRKWCKVFSVDIQRNPCKSRQKEVSSKNIMLEYQDLATKWEIGVHKA